MTDVEPRHCQICGAVFYKRSKETMARWKCRKYCSTECAIKGRRGMLCRGEHLTITLQDRARLSLMLHFLDVADDKAKENGEKVNISRFLIGARDTIADAMRSPGKVTDGRMEWEAII